MQLTTQSVQQFIGGQLEVRNPGEGYLYRGEIATAVVEDNEFRVTCAWMAKMGEDGKWTKDGELNYAASLEIYSVSDIGPGTEGSNRLCLQSRIVGETVVLFPPDGSNLDRAQIEGLEPVPA